MMSGLRTAVSSNVSLLPVSYSEKTYHLVNITKNWTDAKEHCKTNYTDLAIIYDLEDQKKALAAIALAADVWIGLHKDPEWKWSNGEDFMYLNFHTGWGTTTGHDCALSVSGKWQTANCSGVMQYMCQNVTNTSGIMRKTYVYKPVSVQWEVARDACRTEMGDLASITNLKEQQDFDKIAQTGTNLWIGLKKNNSVWNWSSGQPVVNWDASDSIPEKACLKMSKSGANELKWTPEACSNYNIFLCYEAITSFPTQSTSLDMITTVTQPTSSTSRGTSISGTLSYNLTYVDQKKSWIEALQHCQKNHETLVHIINSTVQEHVNQMLSDKTYPNGVWIGLERNILFMCAPWLWTSGPYVNYSNWNSSFPVDPMSQYCGKLVGNGTKWLDACCSEELPFICQG